MDPEQIVPIVFAVIFVVFFVFTFACAFMTTRSLGVSMAMRTKTVAPADFLELITLEERPIVYHLKTTFGNQNHYFATVKQDRVYARSKTPLNFPEHSRIVPLLRVM